MQLSMLTEKDRQMKERGRLREQERAVLNPLRMEYQPMVVHRRGDGDGFPNYNVGKYLLLDREMRAPGSTLSLICELDGPIGSGESMQSFIKISV